MACLSARCEAAAWRLEQPADNPDVLGSVGQCLQVGGGETGMGGGGQLAISVQCEVGGSRRWWAPRFSVRPTSMSGGRVNALLVATQVGVAHGARLGVR
jgi:hypothetical protein